MHLSLALKTTIFLRVYCIHAPSQGNTQIVRFTIYSTNSNLQKWICVHLRFWLKSLELIFIMKKKRICGCLSLFAIGLHTLGVGWLLLLVFYLMIVILWCRWNSSSSYLCMTGRKQKKIDAFPSSDSISGIDDHENGKISPFVVS